MSKTAFIEKIRQKPVILMTVFLGAFFLKEVFLVGVFPMFTGQDEARHYNSVQYAAEPEEKTWKTKAATGEEQDKDRLDTYRFSTEIRNTVSAAGLNANRENSFNKMSFTPDSYVGKNENEINSRPWPPINEISPPDAVTKSIYHKLAAYIEKGLSNESILVRFYAARLFSVMLGTLAVLLFYLTLKNFGFSEKASLALAAITAFQPRFSIYYSSVNYDALLILSFAAFAYAASLILRHGANWKNLTLLAAAAIIGYLDKPTGIILVAAFIFILAWIFWKKFQGMIPSKKNKRLSVIIFILAGAIVLAFFGKYLPFESMGISNSLSSLGEYFSKTLTPGKLSLTARTYWGTLGWTDSAFLDYVVDSIRVIEIISLIGIIWFLFSKNTPAYLPDKKYVWFTIFMIAALQLGIRTADWKIFTDLGRIEIGTPGRYFIPNLALHIALVFTGLGMLVRKRKWFEDILALGAVLMFCFMSYLIFNVIIFRFYL